MKKHLGPESVRSTRWSTEQVPRQRGRNSQPTESEVSFFLPFLLPLLMRVIIPSRTPPNSDGVADTEPFERRRRRLSSAARRTSKRRKRELLCLVRRFHSLSHLFFSSHTPQMHLSLFFLLEINVSEDGVLIWSVRWVSAFKLESDSSF
jgi:hypothetical protein